MDTTGLALLLIGLVALAIGFVLLGISCSSCCDGNNNDDDGSSSSSSSDSSSSSSDSDFPPCPPVPPPPVPPTPSPSPGVSPGVSPGPSPSPGVSPGVSPGPSQSPGVSPGPSPSPGVSPGPSPSPGISPGPGPSPGVSPGPGSSPGVSPGPGLSPVILGDVFGLSYTDQSVSAILNNPNTLANPPVLAKDFFTLSMQPVFIPENPNMQPGTFTADYRWIGSISQNTNSLNPRAGQLDIIDPVTNAIFGLAVDIPGSNTDQVFSIVSSSGAPGVGRFWIAVNMAGGAGWNLEIYDETASGSGVFAISTTFTVVGSSIVDLRVSPDNTKVLVLTNLMAGFNIVVFDAVLVSPFGANDTSVIVDDRSSPPTIGVQTPVSGAFTPDSLHFLVVTSAGLLSGPDRIIKFNATIINTPVEGVALSTFTTGSGSPPTRPLKLVNSGINAYVVHRGTDIFEFINWTLFPQMATQNPGFGGDNTGYVDLLNSPLFNLASDRVAFLFNNGSTMVYIDTLTALQITRNLDPPGAATRFSFFRDGQKLYIGHNNSSSPGPANIVSEVDIFGLNHALNQVSGTDDQTWYVVTSSSANTSGGIPIILGDVFGLSSSDRSVSAILNGANTNTTPPVLANDFGLLSLVPVIIPGQPNMQPGTLTAEYAWIGSISQNTDPDNARSGQLDIINPNTNGIVFASTVDIQGTNADQVFSIVSSFGLLGAGRFWIAVNSASGPNSNLFLYDETAAGSGVFGFVVAFPVPGSIVDLRVSPDNSKVLVLTNANNDFNIFVFAAIAAGELGANNTSLIVDDRSSASPPTIGVQTPVSGAFTPDSAHVLVVTSAGPLSGPDRIIKFNNIVTVVEGVALSNFTTGSGSPPTQPLKLVNSGIDAYVVHRGTDIFEFINWTTFPHVATQDTQFNNMGDGTGYIDVLANEPLDTTTDQVGFIFSSGNRVAYIDTLQSPPVQIVRTPLVPGTRLSFYTDGFKLYIGHNSLVSPTDIVSELDIFGSTHNLNQISGTDSQTWYVVTSSSANTSGGVSGG